ncbi:MAG: cysteine methyltransferase [Halobacteriovoraceae bacterium]|nr:cysteine methyltransferase [Halobacteriovoraceae bacterium]|tara:strand:+ start:2886 stop:3743 length:858 start_codon:yes stop_codon:yes gene_type:complete
MSVKQEEINFNRIQKAIEYIKENFKSQPSLEEISSSVHVSPHHFQRMFQAWAGVTPKQFTQYLSVEYARGLLADQQSIMDVAHETGFSGPSRLHDLFVRIEGMTPGEYKNGGANLNINYSFAETLFGNVLVASTPKGLCCMSFFEDEKTALKELMLMFPNSIFRQITDKFQQDALFIFQKDWRNLDKVKLHLHGTPFQIKVWECLLKIPESAIVSYKDIAEHIGAPNSARAVGTAIGKNPIAFLIPCHRVIQSSGGIGDYRWGATRKQAIIGWEAAKKDLESNDD